MKYFIFNSNGIKKFLLSILVFLCYHKTFAQQEIDSQSITVNATRPICFGSFCINGSGGGSITVAYDGTRTCTGSITLLSGYPVAEPAIFETKLCNTKNISVNFDVTTTMSASNGTLLKMDVGPTEKGINGCTFLANADCNALTTLRVGGTLYITGKTLSGNYSGTFNITFKPER
jgi:hypothetical protein